jgi:hypothetical protein
LARAARGPGTCAGSRTADRQGGQAWPHHSRRRVPEAGRLTATQARPAEIAAIIRGHWLIEDRLQWIRDVTYDEDRSQIRTGKGPRVMASLRNLAITILRLTGETSIAAALRYNARRPSRPLQTIMNC